MWFVAWVGPELAVSYSVTVSPGLNYRVVELIMLRLVEKTPNNSDILPVLSYKILYGGEELAGE